jgi:hypothetical protein
MGFGEWGLSIAVNALKSREILFLIDLLLGLGEGRNPLRRNSWSLPGHGGLLTGRAQC